MAIPSAGTELKLSGIWNEIDSNDYTANNHGSGEDCSLTDLETNTTINTGNDAADRPDGSAPHTMTEWYSYDHDVSSFSLATCIYDFDDQTSSSNTAWVPGGTHSGWDNGTSCVYQPWKQTRQWESEGTGNQRDWYMDDNTTGSSSTGPYGSANVNTSHNNLTSTNYLYTETSSSQHAKYFVCRTPAHNYYQALPATNYNLLLKFMEHGYGNTMGNLRVYADDTPTSNHSLATLLATITGSTRTGYGSSSVDSNSWIPRSYNCNTPVRNDDDYYIYFVSNAATSYRGDRAIDRMGMVGEPPGATCFATGTLIRMANGSSKPIEQITSRDKILSYNFDTEKPEPDTVLKAHKTKNDNLRTITFEDGSTLQMTIDHPIYIKDKGWCAMDPDLSMGKGKWSDIMWPELNGFYQGNNTVGGTINQLEKGDIAYNLLGNTLDPVRIASLGEYDNEYLDVYTFTKLKRNIAFFADHILVGAYGKN